MGAELELTGMDDILKWAEDTGNRVSTVATPALQSAAVPILMEMRHTGAFVDRSGKLRKSLGIGKVKLKNGVYSIRIGDVDGEAIYGWDLERGTSKMAPHPFMRPAFERKKEEAYQIMQEKIKEAISE